MPRLALAVCAVPTAGRAAPSPDVIEAGPVKSGEPPASEQAPDATDGGAEPVSM